MSAPSTASNHPSRASSMNVKVEIHRRTVRTLEVVTHKAMKYPNAKTTNAICNDLTFSAHGAA